MNSLFVFVAILVAVGVTLAKGVRLVPQGFKFVVQRFGKYHMTLQPGLNFVIPVYRRCRLQGHHQGYRARYSQPGSDYAKTTR